MKNIYQKLKGSESGKDLARISIIIIMIMVWVLIDKGNVYGQNGLVGNVIRSEMAEGSESTPSYKVGDEGARIGDDNDELNFTIRPNPVVRDLVFDFEFTVKTGIPYDVVDALGRLAASGTFEPGINVQHLDLSRLRTGVYLIRLDLGNKMDVRRIMKR